jgi:Molybdenum cofactor biosynthesis enzyme
MKKRDYVDFDRWVWISLTQKCQWRCWYCDHPSIVNPTTVDLSYYREFVEMFNEIKGNANIEVSLEGGEIGLLSQDYLDEVFNANLSETYTITTNGLFMQRNYHDRYKDKIHHILYHTVTELNEETTFPDYTFDPSIHVLYTMVVHKHNIKYLDSFLSANLDKTFLPHFLQPRVPGLDFMSKEDFQQIYDIMCDKPNIEDHMKNRVKEIIEYTDKPDTLRTFRFACCNIYNKIIINLPLRKIHRCCISMNTNSVELTYENLKKVLYNEPIYPFHDETCNNCIANFVWLYNSHYMNPNNELNYRRVLFDMRRRGINEYGLF